MDAAGMSQSRRYFVRSADGGSISAYDNMDAAELVAGQLGDGAEVIDTDAPAYHPVVQEVIGGGLQYLEIGGWNAAKLDPAGNLIEAAKKGHTGLIHAYLAKGSDANSADRNGATALHWAVVKASPEAVRLLIEAGVDASKTDAGGLTPLDLARQKGRGEIAEYLADGMGLDAPTGD
ncbi:MAG: hypothetical protein CMM10_08395 [Rhodospirillaceae bacterium]|nr:hypothetical protein [Rhodospirillaceae bacterium]